jgi:ATP-dependent helicase/nuclease subunit A
LLSCDHTRRNATEVVDAVNSVMLAAQGCGEYTDFRAHTTASAQAGAVLSLPAIATDAGRVAEEGVQGGWRDSLTTPRETPEETRRTLECRQAATWLATRMQPGPEQYQPQQLMVLARRRASLSVMQEELRRQHIPALQPEKTQLGDAPEVQDIVALLDVLLSPTNDLALAQALKSPLFGCGDDDLVGLALLARERAGVRVSWFDLLLKAEHGTKDWQGLFTQLTLWQSWLAILPPHDALHAIFHDGDVLARFAAAAPSAARSRVIVNLRAMLAAALEFDGGRYATPYALVRALKAGKVKAPTTANAQAVQLLTVHGAKGLEAPLVLLLDTDGAAPKAETMGVLVDWPGEAVAPMRFTFLASETHPPLCNAIALAVEKYARQREELNGLYVAMTRARHTLVLSSATPARPQPNSWWARVQPLTTPVVLATDATQAMAAQVENPIFTLDELPKPFYSPEKHEKLAIKKEVKRTKPHPTDSTDSTDDTDSRIGQAMHRLLEGLPLASTSESAPLPVAFWTAPQVHAVAQQFALTPEQATVAERHAHAIRTGDAAWVWDSAHIAWHANEVPLTHQGQPLRLDRLVQLHDDTWWVLDYKSTDNPLHNPGYREQLSRYRVAIQKTTPSQTVRAAFLTPQGKVIELD